MHRIIIASLSIAMIATHAVADDFLTQCEAFASGNNGDPSLCPCLAEEAAAAGVSDEFMALETEADTENLSNAAKEVLNACYPDG